MSDDDSKKTPETAEAAETPKPKPPTGAKPNPADRRTEPRRVVHEKCRVLISTENSNSSTPIEGVVTDISYKGLGIFSAAFLDSSTPIMIALKSNRFNHDFQAKVAWCRRIPTTGRIIKVPPSLLWRIGLMLNFRSEDEQKIVKELFETL